MGRDAEIALVEQFLDDLPNGPAAIVLEGQPGIGKTALWRRSIQSASARAYRVLAAQPAHTEAKLSFGGIDDMLDSVLDDVLPTLAPPKRRALEVALLRSDPEGPAPDRRTVYRAVLDVIRELAAEGPLVLAADDIQWLDVPSAGVLKYVSRRLQDDPVGIILTRRVDDPPVSAPLALDEMLSEGRLRRLKLPPLDFSDVHALLETRLNAQFPRHVLVRLYERSEGNPFLALEMGRFLLDQPSMQGQRSPRRARLMLCSVPPEAGSC